VASTDVADNYYGDARAFGGGDSFGRAKQQQDSGEKFARGTKDDPVVVVYKPSTGWTLYRVMGFLVPVLILGCWYFFAGKSAAAALTSMSTLVRAYMPVLSL
jgi:hypothetical protein